jgi:hypothetical protein
VSSLAVAGYQLPVDPVRVTGSVAFLPFCLPRSGTRSIIFRGTQIFLPSLAASIMGDYRKLHVWQKAHDLVLEDR